MKEFDAIVMNDGFPSDEDLRAASNAQCSCVLQRPASEEEMSSYLALTKSAIQTGGNTEGLRRMLMGVLLETEFLYRYEFGAGELNEWKKSIPSKPTGNVFSMERADE
jgi:hypothetical protein